MAEKHTKGEMHGCIVCGKLYQLYVVHDASGRYLDAKIMSAGGKLVPNARRPLVACEAHSKEQIDHAVARVYASHKERDDED
jgi:hypothetical protein